MAYVGFDWATTTDVGVPGGLGTPASIEVPVPPAFVMPIGAVLVPDEPVPDEPAPDEPDPDDPAPDDPVPDEPVPEDPAFVPDNPVPDVPVPDNPLSRGTVTEVPGPTCDGGGAVVVVVGGKTNFNDPDDAWGVVDGPVSQKATPKTASTVRKPTLVATIHAVRGDGCHLAHDCNESRGCSGAGMSALA